MRACCLPVTPLSRRLSRPPALRTDHPWAPQDLWEDCAAANIREGWREDLSHWSNAQACTRALLVIVIREDSTSRGGKYSRSIIHAHLRRGHVDACDGPRGRYERDEYVLCRCSLEAKPHCHACVTFIVIIRDSLRQHSGHTKIVRVQREEHDVRSKTCSRMCRMPDSATRPRSEISMSTCSGRQAHVCTGSLRFRV